MGAIYTPAAVSQLSLHDPLRENAMDTRALNHTHMKGEKKKNILL